VLPRNPVFGLLGIKLGKYAAATALPEETARLAVRQRLTVLTVRNV
jgi:hypothetical protein